MKELKKLYNELGTLQWIGEDKGWDLAIEAVRSRISTMINKNIEENIGESIPKKCIERSGIGEIHINCGDIYI